MVEKHRVELMNGSVIDLAVRTRQPLHDVYWSHMKEMVAERIILTTPASWVYEVGLLEPFDYGTYPEDLWQTG